MSANATGDFASSLSCLVEPALAELTAELDLVAGLTPTERGVIRAGVGAALYEAMHRKVSRVLVVELNAARVTGRLTAADSAARWSEFLAMSAQPGYWESLGEHYPTMLPRLRAMLAKRGTAALAMAQRLAADRGALTTLCHADPGELVGISVGAGDTHNGGSVTILRFAAGTVVYKPRPLDVDIALDELLAAVFGELPPLGRIRVPSAIPRPGYGWAEFVTHRYCATEEELSGFYLRIGHWLAVMRLLSGTDLHLENVIAHGPAPVVVDCETLFTPIPPMRPSGLGLAVDRADALVRSTVLRSGMLPNRGVALGWRGVDASAVGALPGQQPAADLPVIVDAGTDRARIGFRPVPVGTGASHPSRQPALAHHWHRVGAGFTEASETLRAMDRDGRLRPLLDGFRNCVIRVVPRSTESYTEIARMLWHPVSLHDPSSADDRAAGLLAAMARSTPGAPDDERVIAAEVADLLVGDVPVFTTTAGHGRLTGPGGTAWLPERDLVDDALARWRDADLDVDRGIIRAALASAYRTERWTAGARRPAGPAAPVSDVDRRRRDRAAALVRRVRDAAHRAEDGTATWVAPVLQPTGWSVQPLNQGLYNGMPGVAVLLAAYQRETAAGRADPVEGIPALLDAVLRTMRLAEAELGRTERSPIRPRPQPPGGYVGIGSRIWAWLTLDRLAGAGTDGVTHARWQAERLAESVAADDRFDLLTGMAGAIVPLLALAAAAGEDRWIERAAGIGDRLAIAARWTEDTAYWVNPVAPNGLGGFAHGSTGIGWALARLALTTGDPAVERAARGALAFEEALYDPTLGGWRDLRDLPAGPSGQPEIPAGWCHGAVGIGLAAVDLARHGWSDPHLDEVPHRAMATASRYGLGWNPMLCHGDLGCWELLKAAATPGDDIDARMIGALDALDDAADDADDAGPLGPGLLTGVGGLAYQLLRMHPDNDLPSVLTLA